MASANPIDVLLVEDNAGDVGLLREALDECQLLPTLHVASDGEQAMHFLRRTGGHEGAPRPALILLDLNIPRLNGREVLTRVKQDENLRTIPVIVLTSSVAPTDVSSCYALHANCYLVKPADFAGFLALARSIEDFWFRHVELSPGA